MSDQISIRCKPNNGLFFRGGGGIQPSLRQVQRGFVYLDISTSAPQSWSSTSWIPFKMAFFLEGGGKLALSTANTQKFCLSRLLARYQHKCSPVLVLNKLDTIPKSRRIYDLIRKSNKPLSDIFCIFQRSSVADQHFEMLIRTPPFLESVAVV